MAEQSGIAGGRSSQIFFKTLLQEPPMELNSNAIKPTNQMCHGDFIGAYAIASSKERTAVPKLITGRTEKEQSYAA